MRFAIIDDLDEERARALKLFEEYRDVRHVSFLIDDFSSGEDFLSSEDHMGDAFSVHAFDYLLKPLNQDRLFTCLDDSMKLLPKPEEYLSFTSNGLEMRLFYGNIVVLQVSGHSTVLIDSTGKEYSVYSAFSVFTKPLMEDSRFLLVSRGVLINMDFISGFTSKTCELQNGLTVPITIRKQKMLEQAWHNYTFSRLHHQAAKRTKPL